MQQAEPWPPCGVPTVPCLSLSRWGSVLSASCGSSTASCRPYYNSLSRNPLKQPHPQQAFFKKV
eukprot:1158883-Pelagomonas_calceolata.AAC.4